MTWIVVTIIIVLLTIFILHLIANKCNLSEHMKNIPTSEVISVSALITTVIIMLLFLLFGELDWFTNTGVKIFGCLILYFFIISGTISKLLLALFYKQDKYSLDELKDKKREDDIKQVEKAKKDKEKRKNRLMGAIIIGGELSDLFDKKK